MLIRCPECRFERTIDADAIPANAMMATCPRCQCRFRFRNPDGTPTAEGAAPAPVPPQQTAPPAQPPLPPDMEGDDPLPPGAVVPRIPGEDAATPHAEEKPSPAETPDEKPSVSGAQEKPSFWEHFQKKKNGESRGGLAAALHADETDVPWEEPRRYNPLMALYQTILRVMFNAPRFFAALPASNGKLTRPLAFYLILGLFQTLVERMWYLMSLEASAPSITDPKLQELLGDVAQSMSLPLTILIPSSSGLATLSVPIMAPLGKFAGVGGDLVVTAFQSASGLVNIITPTAAVVMGALALGHVPYDRWVK